VALIWPARVGYRCRTHYAANVMSVCPRSSWPGVRAMLLSAYDQPDAASVHAQFDRLIDTVADSLVSGSQPAWA
jgi:putative transposase